MVVLASRSTSILADLLFVFARLIMKGLAVRSPLIKPFICLVEKTSLLLLFLQLLPYLVSFYFSFSFLFYFQSLWVSMFKQWYSNPISVLVLVFVVYNRRREAQIKYPNPDDDVRENIINYEDEGGGEDDMTAFDITPLQIPVADPNMMVGHHPHHFHSLPRPTKVPVSCKWNLQFWNFAPFCFDFPKFYLVTLLDRKRQFFLKLAKMTMYFAFSLNFRTFET